jgi:hypothetical protein
MSNAQHQSTFLEAVAKYWQGYALTDEAESPYLRKWSSETLSRGMVSRALAMLDAHVSAEIRQNRPAEEYVRKDEVIQTANYRNWNGIRLSLVGAESISENGPSDTLQEVVSKALEESLVVCILPSSYVEPWQNFVTEARGQGHFLITMYPIDVNTIARGRLTLLDLVEFKLYRQILLDKPENETQFSETSYVDFNQGAKRQSWLVDLGSAIDNQSQQPAKWAEHPKLELLIATIHENTDSLLVGPSSSGKSTLAFQCGRKLKSLGYEVRYIDSGAVSPQIASHVLSSLQHFAKQGNALLIIDDIQSSPSVARYILTLTRLLRLAGSAENLNVMAISWPDYAQQIQRELKGWSIIDVVPSDAQRVLLAKYKNVGKAPSADELLAVAGDDILVWRLILDSPRLQSSGLSRQSIADEVWSRKTKTYRGDIDMAKRVILVAAILGRYELELTEGFIENQTGVNKTSLSLMYKTRILRKNGDKTVLGHRSLCSLLADKLSREEDIWSYFRSAGKPSKPVDIIQEYIRSVDAAEVWVLLKTLRGQVGFKDIASIDQRAQTLADAWQAIDSLVERIEQQEAIDFSWGTALSSTLFAVEALSSIGKREKARPSIEFMRTYWKATEENIAVFSGTNERFDFDQILSHMQEEDDTVGAPFPNAQSAKEIDPNRFHHTWINGVILCSEAAFKEKKPQELERLAILVERLQEPDGNFYPSRVPWCTARVLMGLTRCGRKYSNSLSVKKACDWLLRPITQGGVYQDGVWESGTGVWNTSVETTAMCMLALILAGIPTNDPRLQPAWKFLLSRRSEWVKSKRELDGVLALSAHVAISGDWQDVRTEVYYLLKWARGEAFWDSAAKTSKETFDQSLKVVFIAATLIDVVWSTLRFSLPIFLDAFAVPKVTIGETDRSNINGLISEESIDRRGADMASILFLTADPTNESRLRVGEELREIQEKLQLARLRQQFQLHQRMSVRPADISQALLDVKPRIVHFSGHGTSTGALCFEDKTGSAKPVEPSALAALFEQFANDVDCVVLNACYSKIQGDAIAQHINYVVGMDKAIGDKAAIAFAIGFYQALGAGRSIEDAYKLGCVQIRLQGIPEHLTPVLIKKV